MWTYTNNKVENESENESCSTCANVTYFTLNLPSVMTVGVVQKTGDACVLLIALQDNFSDLGSGEKVIFPGYQVAIVRAEA